MKERENFASRLGFILISAGCAIGLGNVWRFPYIVGQYGGGAFVLMYLVFLVLLGIPIMTMEFSVGRASQRSITTSFNELEPKGTKWHLHGYAGIAGNYLLMMFYTTVAGWMFYYFIKMLRGDFVGLSAEGVQSEFTNMLSNPQILIICMVIVVMLGMGVCALGLEKGVERVTKVIMLALLGILVILAIRSCTLKDAQKGLEFYLKPDFHRVAYDADGNNILFETIFAAMGQAFFTLSIGMGNMAIFGSYIGKDRTLFGEAISVTALDTFVAIVVGLVIFPSAFAYGVNPGEGPGLVFITLPNIFNQMPGGQIWGALFFVFMSFAAMSTVIAVFENIISGAIDKFGWSRKKAVLVNLFAIIILSLPCALGFNLLSGFTPLGTGTNVLDLEDFIISNNILPLGSLVYLMFCISKKGWGWDNFLEETNTGKGIKFPRGIYGYLKFVLPIIVLFIFVMGYYNKFFA